MKNFHVIYKKGEVEKLLKTREADEENAILQALTLWQLKDGKVVRRYITVKQVKTL